MAPTSARNRVQQPLPQQVAAGVMDGDAPARGEGDAENHNGSERRVQPPMPFIGNMQIAGVEARIGCQEIHGNKMVAKFMDPGHAQGARSAGKLFPTPFF